MAGFSREAAAGQVTACGEPAGSEANPWSANTALGDVL